jgi:CheY-like chemotaxis protein
MNERKRSPRMPTILVIDDSDIDRRVISELLEQAGFGVHSLPTAIGATRAARDCKACLVVIDQNLPALDGAKLATLFRRNPITKDVRVLLISSSDEVTMTRLVSDAQADGFVSKSRMHAELVATVQRLLAH